jgi:hypothetical protein
MASHARFATATLARKERHEIRDFTNLFNSASGILLVKDNRKRALPSGTVGGRIAFTAKPSRCR